jgi:hypothetical protein
METTFEFDLSGALPTYDDLSIETNDDRVDQARQGRL